MNCIRCSQGRAASDQHIVDVVLKMIQGKGQAAAPPHSPLLCLVTLLHPLQVRVSNPWCAFHFCLPETVELP